MSRHSMTARREDTSLYELMLMISREWRAFIWCLIACLTLSLIAIAYKVYAQPPKESRVYLIGLGGYTQTMESSGYLDLMPFALQQSLFGTAAKKRERNTKDEFIPFLDISLVEYKVLEKFHGIVRKPGDHEGNILLLPAEKDKVALESAKKNNTVGPYRPHATLKLVAYDNVPGIEGQVKQIISFIRQEEVPKVNKFLVQSKAKLAFNEKEMFSVDKEIKRDKDVLTNYTAVRVHDVASARIVSTELGFLTNFSSLRKERFALLAQNNLLREGIQSTRNAELFLSYRQPNNSLNALKYIVISLFGSFFLSTIGAFLTAMLRQQARSYQLARTQHE